MEQISFKLPVFEGPMDLLLHLIRKHKLNINDIPIFDLVEQYLQCVRQMQEEDMDLASEFLEMAARLVYIKTVSLLPVHEEADELKRELTGELIEYRDCQMMAVKLSQRTEGFHLFVREPMEIEQDLKYTRIHESIELYQAYMSAVGKGQRKLPPPVENFTQIVAKRIVSVASKISFVMRKLFKNKKMKLSSLYEASTDRSELVATFLAVLQLARDRKIHIDGEGEAAKVKIIGEGDEF